LPVATAIIAYTIYSQTIKQTVAGKYATFTTNLTGYLIISTGSGTFQINANAKTKTFTVIEYDNYKLEYVNSSVARRKLVMATEINEEVGTVFVKGDVASLNIGVPGGFSAPQTMKLSGSGFSGDAPLAVLTEYSGVFAFDFKKTKANNVAGNDAEATVNYLKAFLGGRGYTEIP